MKWLAAIVLLPLFALASWEMDFDEDFAVASWKPPDVLDGLVGRWTFDDVAGSTVPDASGNGNTGALDGGAAIEVGGVTGNALVLIADVPGRVILNNATMTSVGGGDWTVTWWTKGLKTYGNAPIYSGVLIFGGYGVVMGGYTAFSILLNDTANMKWPVPSPNNWTFCAMTKNGTSYTLSINGVDITSTSFADNGWGTGGMYEIGVGYNYPVYKYLGMLDDVRLYNRALSSNEVATIYNFYK